MKVKEESENFGLKLNIQNTKIMASGPISSVQLSSVAQSCPALCDPMNHSTPGLPVHNILLALLPGRKLVNTGVFFVSKIYVC